MNPNAHPIVEREKENNYRKAVNFARQMIIAKATRKTILMSLMYSRWGYKIRMARQIYKEAKR